METKQRFRIDAPESYQGAEYHYLVGFSFLHHEQGKSPGGAMYITSSSPIDTEEEIGKLAKVLEKHKGGRKMVIQALTPLRK